MVEHDSVPADPEPPDDGAAAPGRLRATTERANRARDDALRQVDRLRTEHDLVDAALQAGDLDRRRAGSLLAGGIAFRVFLWMLPAALLGAGVIGLVRPRGSSQPERVAHTLGLGASVGSMISHATRQANKGTAFLIAAGLVLTLYTSMSLVRSMRVAFILAWEEPFGRRPKLLRDGAILSGALIGLLITETGISYLRHRAGVGVSLFLGVVPVALGAAVWVGVSLLLPHARGATWRALLPGAALFAVGMALLHFASVYYFAPKLTKAPVLYGSLGTAATLLLWLFVIARIVVASAFLNATLWRRQHAPAEPPA